MWDFLDFECTTRDEAFAFISCILFSFGRVITSQRLTPVSQTVDNGVSTGYGFGSHG